MSSNPSNSDFLTTAQLARLIGASARTIARAVDKGYIPAYRVGPRGYRRIHRKDAENALRRYSTHKEDFL